MNLPETLNTIEKWIEKFLEAFENLKPLYFETCSVIIPLTLGSLLIYFFLFWYASWRYRETEETLDKILENRGRTVTAKDTFFGELVIFVYLCILEQSYS